MTPDELAITVATTLAAKGAEAAFASGRSAVGALFRLVRDRLGRRGHDAEMLQAAIDRPGDQDRLAALADALVRAMIEDPALASRLREALPGGMDAAVVNQFSGSATKVVQARDVHGDVTL